MYSTQLIHDAAHVGPMRMQDGPMTVGDNQTADAPMDARPVYITYTCMQHARRHRLKRRTALDDSRNPHASCTACILHPVQSESPHHPKVVSTMANACSTDSG